MNELDNLVDEIYGAIAKYLTDNLIDIKDVKMGDSAVDYQISEAKRLIDSDTKGRIAKDEIVHWNTINNIKRRNGI
jgi:hypothetical protein